MSYGIFTDFKFFRDTPCPVFATFFNALFFLTQFLIPSSFSRFVKSNCTADTTSEGFWRTVEIFDDGGHFDFLLQHCCLFRF